MSPPDKKTDLKGRFRYCSPETTPILGFCDQISFLGHHIHFQNQFLNVHFYISSIYCKTHIFERGYQYKSPTSKHFRRTDVRSQTRIGLASNPLLTKMKRKINRVPPYN